MSQIANSFVHVNPAAILKELRLEAGLTQQQLADKAGLDRSWVNQMERGRKKITRAPREKLAAALGVSPVELGGGEQEDPATHRTLHQRLEELEKALQAEKRLRERGVRAVTRRLAELEAALDSLTRTEDQRRSGQ